MFNRIKKAIDPNSEMSFLEHLESLRWHLVRSVVVLAVLAVSMFFLNDFIFGTIIFGPKNPDFITYRVLCRLSHAVGLGSQLCLSAPPIKIINTELAGQLMMSMWVAFIAGVIIAMPYILWELWRFIKPGLKESEAKGTRGVVFYVTVLFAIGVLFGYYVIVPWTVNFLGNYQVSGQDVVNMIRMDSYISTVTNLVLSTGLVFELPIVIYFLAKFGIISAEMMRKYRKHAIVIILLIGAIITPPDVASQIIVSVPLYLLFELSIFVSKYVERKQAKEA